MLKTVQNEATAMIISDYKHLNRKLSIAEYRVNKFKDR